MGKIITKLDRDADTREKKAMAEFTKKERRKEYPNFIKIYMSMNSPRLIKLSIKSGVAMGILLYLVEKAFADRPNQTERAHVIVPQQHIRDDIGVSMISIARSLKLLEDMQFIKTLHTSAGLIYAINPDDFWKSDDGHKYKALFNQDKELMQISCTVVCQEYKTGEE